MSRKEAIVGKKKTAPKEPRPVVTESAFNAYVSELYDYGLDGREVDEVLRSGAITRRGNPKGRDFDNSYVWNTSDRLDRAFGLAQRRLAMVRDYEKRIKQISQLLESVRLWSGLYGDPEQAKTLLEATKAFIATPVTPWADGVLTTDLVLCSICQCELCLARIKDEKLKCCDHKDDNGSWGLPF